MKVPYSMDDNEPDLYGSLGSHYEPDEEVVIPIDRTCQYRFYTQDDMNKVIQKNLEAIAELRKEIDEAYDKGYWQGRDDGYDEGYNIGYEQAYG